MSDKSKCTDGQDHDWSEEVEDKNQAGEVIGTTFVCSKCGVRFDDFMAATS